MSTEIATILTNAAALAQTGLDEDTAAIAGSIGSKRISIAGGTFRMIVNGKEQAAIEDRHMNVVFVKMSHMTHHALGTPKRIKKVRRHHLHAGRKILKRRIPKLKNHLRLPVPLVLTLLKVLGKVGWVQLAVYRGVQQSCYLSS
jgi:hypothetical protein